MTPDDYLDALPALPNLDTPAISPDGRWAAWTWYNVGPAADLYRAPTNGSAPPTRLTDTPDDTCRLGRRVTGRGAYRFL